MPLDMKQLQGMMTGTQESRVEALRQFLDYPLKQRDPEGSRFWFLRPGADEAEAEDTCPIAVGFYSELDGLTNDDIKQFLTTDEQQREIYGHYTGRIIPNQPVMYLLLPEGEGRVAMILPTDGKLRQRQIQTFSWSDEDLQARLNRLRQDTLARTNRMKDAALSVIPLVEWAFYKPITTAKELAQKLAEVSRRIERVIPDVYRAEPNDGYLRGLLRSFQKELLPTLKLEPENEKDYSFADIYAQTIAYGLFTARVFSYTIDERRRRDEADPARKETDFNREDAWELLPETNPFLRRLFRDVSKAVGEYDRGAASDESPVIADELIDAISEVVSILRAAKMDAILEDFRAKMNREDIVIRFYEDFLDTYKPEMRKRAGVYYTPEPIVSYIVRSVDLLLIEKFSKPLGLADPDVMILDPACGTGTFLFKIFQLIYKRFIGQEKDENYEMLPVYEALKRKFGEMQWSDYVKKYLLPRLFGFELLMAPYAISHLKLGLFLEETGYQFDGGVRLGVYLTNALEQSSPKKPEIIYEEFIVDEGVAALEIKQSKPIMLVIGNPPYSSSTFEGDWIMQLMEDYKKDLNERKQDLNREEWKFLRFAQEKIIRSGKGIVAFVINNTFLDAVTHKALRESILSVFSEVNILDLHGSVDKKEKAPDGTKDVGVFDIKQGVSIFISTKMETSIVSKNLNLEINHLDCFGSRESKYQYLYSESLKTTKWNQLKPCESEYFFFSKKNFDLKSEYEIGFPLLEIFQYSASGVQTKKDHFAMHFTYADLSNVIHDVQSLSESVLREKYNLGDDGRDWILKLAIQDVKSYSNPEDLFKKIQKTPFNYFYNFYSGKTKGFLAYPRYEVFKNIIRPNLGLSVMRQVVLPNAPYSHFFAVDTLFTDRFFYSNRGTPYFLPLYLYPDADTPVELQEQTRLNFKLNFLENIKANFGYVPPAESIFYYIYAIFHSPTYRLRYLEFLKIDFPRIPFTKDTKLFHKLQSYGQELVNLHLMKFPKHNLSTINFVNNGGNGLVELGSLKCSDERIIINSKGDRFTEVPEEVWNFYVGGYQVCQKWLKDRKGRTLTPEDITHYQRIIVALQETIRLMQQIDEAIPEFPLP